MQFFPRRVKWGAGKVWWPAGACLVPLSLTLSFACNTFSPRDPQPPCDPLTDRTCRVPPPVREPLTPEIVRDNYRNLFEAFVVDPNLLETLTLDQDGGFVYVPDTQAQSEDSQGVFDNWNRANEINFMRNLLESGGDIPDRISLVFNVFEDTGEFPDANKVRYNVEYELTLDFPPVEGAPRQERYCARALWDLIGGNRNFWSLQRWEDIEPLDIPNDPCLGTLGSLRVRLGN